MHRSIFVAPLLLASPVACALFANPFEKVAELLGPTEGPISLAKRNFALPTHERLREVHAVPPVYAIDNFLSDDECDILVAAAENGEFPAVPYGLKNKIFTGTKWAAHELTPEVDIFLDRCSATFDTTANRFDPVTVTRYRSGEYQTKHLDARLPHQINRNKAYMKSGGQRIAQLICYLQTPTSGGETRFFGPAFGGLAVPPQKGTALVFPTATSDGLADERYLHSGEPVTAGTKYIIGTWLMEAQRTDAADVRKQIEALYELEGRSAPPRSKARAGASTEKSKSARAGKTAKRRRK